MATENFTTYTEVDPNAKLTVTASKVTWANLTRDETAYVYIDKGINYFAGNFIHLLTVSISASVNECVIIAWGLNNSVTPPESPDCLRLRIGDDGAGGYHIGIWEWYGGVDRSDFYFSASLNTPYYIKLVRDETLAQLTCYIYSDAARTTLLDTLVVNLTAPIDFRYLYACAVLDQNYSTRVQSGYTENLELLALSVPTVTTQAVTDIAGTTATGNGNITNLGVPNPTQHGHCWNTTGTPTTTDSKTQKGAASATGAFTSSLTSLNMGTLYYVRAYATNMEGTSYGSEVTFTTLFFVPKIFLV